MRWRDWRDALGWLAAVAAWMVLVYLALLSLSGCASPRDDAPSLAQSEAIDDVARATHARTLADAEVRAARTVKDRAAALARLREAEAGLAAAKEALRLQREAEAKEREARALEEAARERVREQRWAFAAALASAAMVAVCVALAVAIERFRAQAAIAGIAFACFAGGALVIREAVGVQVPWWVFVALAAAGLVTLGVVFVVFATRDSAALDSIACNVEVPTHALSGKARKRLHKVWNHAEDHLPGFQRPAPPPNTSIPGERQQLPPESPAPPGVPG